MRLREESLLKDHPGFAALAAQVKAGAGKVAVAGTAATTAEPPHVSPPGPKVDVRLARASLLSALGLARVEVKDAKGEEALATLGRSRALFDELARERPGDPEVERDRDQVVLNLWTALDELARSSLQAGRPAEAAGYRTRASDRAAETAGALSRNLAVIPRTSRVFYWLTPTVSMLEETHVANDAVFNELARLRPRDPFVYVCRADALAHRGDWAGAAAAMKTLLALDPDNYTYWYVASAGFPHAGDVESYRRVCREMLDRFERSGDPDVAMWSALACLTLPDAVDDYSAPAERAARALRAVRARGSGLADLYPIYFDIAAAGVDYRAGRFEAAVKRLSARNYELPVNRGVFGATSHMILATAYHRLGRAAEARRELNMTSEVLRVHPESAKWEVPPLGVWDDWLRYNILRREAEALILDPDFPADPFAI